MEHASDGVSMAVMRAFSSSSWWLQALRQSHATRDRVHGLASCSGKRLSVRGRRFTTFPLFYLRKRRRTAALASIASKVALLRGIGWVTCWFTADTPLGI